MCVDANEKSREQQVWQRVFSNQEQGPRGESLGALQREAMELAALYRYLQSVLTGQQREQVQKLYQGEKANGASLRGMTLLLGQREEVLKVWNPAREPLKAVLESCYVKTRRCMVEYMGRSAEPEFGVVFRTLADREAQHCAILTELLGSFRTV